MFEAVLSSGISYVFGKIWGTIGFIIKRYQERKDNEIKMKYEMSVKEIDLEIAKVNAQNILDIETVKSTRDISVAKDNLEATNISIQPELMNVELANKNAIREEERIAHLTKLSSLFRIILGGIAVFYVYTLGFTAFFVSIRLHGLIIVFKEIENVFTVNDVTPHFATILEEYLIFPLEIIKQVFHSGITVITFYFGSMHAHNNMHDKSSG